MNGLSDPLSHLCMHATTGGIGNLTLYRVESKEFTGNRGAPLSDHNRAVPCRDNRPFNPRQHLLSAPDGILCNRRERKGDVEDAPFGGGHALPKQLERTCSGN